MVSIGQGLWGRVRFRDGEMPAYNRPYLVVSISDQHVGLLSVSTVAGKERQLVHASNRELNAFKPPFSRPSFVKLGSLVYIEISDLTNMRVLAGGQPLCSAELEPILRALEEQFDTL